MGSTICKTCGYISDEINEKFCPNCGSSFGETDEEKVEQKAEEELLVKCPKCGFINSNPGAKFCEQCGAGFDQSVETPAPQQLQDVPASPPVMNIGSGSNAPRPVVGTILKENLLAKLLEGDLKMNGRLEIRRDGVTFVSSQRFNKLVQCQSENISQVKVGNKPGIFGIMMKNGDKFIFKVGNAQKWVKYVQDILPK